ncbi:hypothetical protein AFLA_006996 [Aspergillus flavus NRRL3357]|nr:hypothetical protein AFLA_006996 [Aspergillus flavus NRRL3357]
MHDFFSLKSNFNISTTMGSLEPPNQFYSRGTISPRTITGFTYGRKGPTDRCVSPGDEFDNFFLAFPISVLSVLDSWRASIYDSQYQRRRWTPETLWRTGFLSGWGYQIRYEKRSV